MLMPGGGRALGSPAPCHSPLHARLVVAGQVLRHQPTGEAGGACTAAGGQPRQRAPAAGQPPGGGSKRAATRRSPARISLSHAQTHPRSRRQTLCWPSRLGSCRKEEQWPGEGRKQAQAGFGDVLGVINASCAARGRRQKRPGASACGAAQRCVAAARGGS